MGQELLAAGLAHGRITLKSAAETINALHKEAMGHCKAGLHKAREAGKLLAEARKHIKHGAFTAWVDETCDFSYATANRYIKLHESWDELVEAVGSRMPDMTINEGIKRIAQITKEKQDEWSKRAQALKSLTVIDQNTTIEGASKDGPCIRGGEHFWESDPELAGEFCANCHEPRDAVGETDDTHAAVDTRDAQEQPAEETDKSLAAGRVEGLRKRIDGLLGVLMGLYDELHQEAQDEARRDNAHDGLRIMTDDLRQWGQ